MSGYTDRTSLKYHPVLCIVLSFIPSTLSGTVPLGVGSFPRVCVVMCFLTVRPPVPTTVCPFYRYTTVSSKGQVVDTVVERRRGQGSMSSYDTEKSQNEKVLKRKVDSLPFV